MSSWLNWQSIRPLTGRFGDRGPGRTLKSAWFVQWQDGALLMRKLPVQIRDQAYAGVTALNPVVTGQIANRYLLYRRGQYICWLFIFTSYIPCWKEKTGWAGSVGVMERKERYNKCRLITCGMTGISCEDMRELKEAGCEEDWFSGRVMFFYPAWSNRHCRMKIFPRNGIETSW